MQFVKWYKTEMTKMCNISCFYANVGAMRMMSVCPSVTKVDRFVFFFHLCNFVKSLPNSNVWLTFSWGTKSSVATSFV